MTEILDGHACAGLLNARISRCNTKHRFQIGGCRDDGQAAHKRNISKKDNTARPPLTATALMEVPGAGADVRTGPPAPAKAAAATVVAAGAAAGALLTVDPAHAAAVPGDITAPIILRLEKHPDVKNVDLTQIFYYTTPDRGATITGVSNDMDSLDDEGRAHT
jgi:hypothetical protein